MRKVLSFFYVLWIIILLTTSMLVFIPYAFLRLMQFQRAADAYLTTLAHGYGRLVFFSARVKLDIKGAENLPKEDRALVFVANHQSITDVIVLKTVIPYPMGFMAKIELFRVPFVQVWLAGLRCIAIDRSNLRKSMEAIRKGSSQVASGYPMVIFPEGTRSRCNGMRAFKGGSLKLAEWAKGRIVPITLDGTHRLITKDGLGFGETVTVTFHRPIDTSQTDREEMKALPKRLWETVNSGLAEPNAEVMPPKEPKKEKSAEK